MKKLCSTLLLLCFAFSLSFAQKSTDSPWQEATFKGLELRNIGPAFMSGRIADIAIHPKNDNTWYVAVASGGVWKTINAGVTWTPVFDQQTSYSTGCVTIDPSNPHIVWVGTGENDGGRHIGFGDGVYKSEDGGKSWKNMGLKNSEHLSKIIVHPNNSNIVWAASQGPLWSKGGERGLYKSTDGGESWKRVLGDDEWTGVTEVVIDPRNPDRLYAATWQRHRTLAAYMGGGPKSGLHRSEDGGETWTQLKTGLPSGNIGKIGLDISPQQPDVLYAALELNRRQGAVYRSSNRGGSWEKMSDAVSGATGPHYYQELYASPHQFDRIYLMDVRIQISDDGGKTFRQMSEQHKHSDNHAIAFRKDDPGYLLIGTDGGMYESFDLAQNWRFISNLPLTQFYKIALDDAEPFYNVFGGTQDNSTQGGPSRTDNPHGIQNSDWKVVLDWDGHQPATEPGNPNIMYGERQQGTLSRIDMTTGEVTDIQPQPGPDEPHERFNWDAPILVSPHSPTRIYFASYRVWKSDNRGDEWTAISGDLTKSQDRMELPIMGKKQSWDSPWDMLAMSNYNTITSLAESPQQSGLLYVGTDDGLIQVTEDGGQNWRKIEVGSIPGVPATAFVNDIKADLFDAGTVYVCLDNHKYGDYKPYLAKSTDKGKSWASIAGDLPNRHLVWRLVQDHVNPNLLFAATEFGIFFTVDGGKKWTKITGGAPTISFRDLAIHRRENDLVGASFGRGIYILDDYTALREVNNEVLAAEAKLFPTRKAWWYVPRPHLGFDEPKGSMGAAHYTAPNPAFGAVFTYYLKDGYSSEKESRQETEKALAKANKETPYPGWEALEKEMMEMPPKVWLTIKNNSGQVVRRIEAPAKKGFHRIAWDLKYPAPDPISLSGNGNANASGLMAAPGTYTATLSKQIEGAITNLSEPITFEVVPLYKGALEGASTEAVAQFWREYETLSREASALQMNFSKLMQKSQAMQTAFARSNAAGGELTKQLHSLHQNLMLLSKDLFGSPAKQQIGEKTKPTIGERLFAIDRGIYHSTYGPTETHKQTMAIIKDQLREMTSRLDRETANAGKIAKALMEAGAPFIEGEVMPNKH